MKITNNNRTIPRMRTAKEAAQEIKQLVEHTAMTEWHIRKLALSGVLPRVKSGKKLLINLDMLYEYLENPAVKKFKPKQNNNAAAQNGIRRIV